MYSKEALITEVNEIINSVKFSPVTLNTTGRETPYFLLTSGLKHGPWRHAAANK